jgi:membrane fusion protein, adhesin transport system
MSYERYYTGGDAPVNRKLVARLQSYHERRFSPLLYVLAAGLLLFIAWAATFRIDEVARAVGEVITSSRVQIIQAVDGGVLSELNVHEGDRVSSGQVLARLDQTRIGAAVLEVEARLSALKAKAVRLLAEVTGASRLEFSKELLGYPEQIKVEEALFEQRRTGLVEDLRTLGVAVNLAREEVTLLKELSASGDVNRSEVIRVERNLNDAEARLSGSKNKFLEDARVALTHAEDEIAQNEQVLAQRRQQFEDSVFVALMPGIVKNIRVTTVGGVLRAGEELMQIVPVDEALIIEAKVSPSDISRVHAGQPATIRFDPFDYTIYGSVAGEVIYVSADTLKESTGRGTEIYYRAHLKVKSNPVVTSVGKTLDILPGMTARVDIRSGERTLINYLLKPLKKTLMESFGEK